MPTQAERDAYRAENWKAWKRFLKWGIPLGVAALIAFAIYSYFEGPPWQSATDRCVRWRIDNANRSLSDIGDIESVRRWCAANASQF